MPTLEQPQPHPEVQVVLWEDIFAVVDTGRGDPSEYTVLRDLIIAQAKKFAGGIGCLAIIPQNATPPPDETRTALNAALAELGGSLRCICWLVEGTGFQGAMVRAILTGLNFVARRSYATHVSTNMNEAIGWILTHLANPRNRSGQIAIARDAIESQRQDRAPLEAP
jgi:hypothetical protein